MNSIEIFINNLYSEMYLYIDIKNNVVKINNKEKNIDDEDINNLIRIIRNWDNEYKSNKIIDGEQFIIKLNTSKGTEVIKGKGDYPKNYHAFKELVGRLYD